MKFIALRPYKYGMMAVVDDDDYNWLRSWSWRLDNGYARRAGDGLQMHRLINKTPDGLDTDHKNQNRLDNRRVNLRTATRSMNGHNRDKFSNNTSGVKGVSWHKSNKVWRARITIEGRSIYVASSKDKDRVALALQDFKREAGIS